MESLSAKALLANPYIRSLHLTNRDSLQKRKWDFQISYGDGAMSHQIPKASSNDQTDDTQDSCGEIQSTRNFPTSSVPDIAMEIQIINSMSK